MCNDVGEGSRCCAFYSVTGFIFTVSLILFALLRSGKKTKSDGSIGPCRSQGPRWMDMGCGFVTSQWIFDFVMTISSFTNVFCNFLLLFCDSFGSVWCYKLSLFWLPALRTQRKHETMHSEPWECFWLAFCYRWLESGMIRNTRWTQRWRNPSRTINWAMMVCPRMEHKTRRRNQNGNKLLSGCLSCCMNGFVLELRNAVSKNNGET